MPFRLGFRIAYRFAQSTPMVAMLDVADSEAHRLLSGPTAWTSPQVPLHRYRDRFGNTCTRLLAPAGLLVLRGEALVRDGSFRPAVAPAPEDLGPFLQPSRHCEVRPLLRHAQARFGDLPSDRVRVQAICAHVARSIDYVPETADCTRGALRALQDGQGLCRDFAHVAIALCRGVGVPARYCTGYPPPGTTPEPRFPAWIEAWFDGRWHAFDPRTGGACPARVPVARGRDAADVATSCTFGLCEPESVEVWALEEAAAAAAAAGIDVAALALAS
ncbi:transglutaminase family protein [Pseudoxanthomonas sp. SGD-10]|uniref:transglutaminase-like domain-containing protein n=1 Tax=Pseudoxanthomonas sp. GW2 TaxID=1211114 RepID=UPI00030961EC|nr:transglutaminase family protein [Pseudoxanthomonas sp. GW2]RRN78315.1 transglutaminase family protein [Pseudoxanthomonas sp. SGD-10]